MKSPLHQHNIYYHFLFGSIAGYIIHREVQSFYESPILFCGYLIPVCLLIAMTIHLITDETK